MNNGKICVSVCAKTADELFKQIKQAEDLADVIEIRFDCLGDDSRIKDVLAEVGTWRNKVRKPFLFTFRPTEQGGKRSLDKKERLSFWSWRDDGKGNFGGKVILFADLVDLEIDLFNDLNWSIRFKNLFEHAKQKEFWNSFESIKVESYLKETIISSFHDFIGIPKDIEGIFHQLYSIQTDAVKIAAQADDITDSIPVWKLLEKAKKDNKQIIPIAMGEAGKWTRILGLAHGAFMTYAALDEKNATAPGQITAREMIDVYRVKELNENTEIYGIIGGNTSYSMSPFMHNAAFKFHNLNAVFVPLQVQNLDDFMRRMVKPETREIELNFKGFAVTIPHKTAIIKYLDEIDETAEKIGAVNTVKIVEGKLYGYNTDAQGFIEPLKNVYGNLENAKIAICGAGGAARACVYALKKENAKVTIFARNTEKAQILAEEFQVQWEKLSADYRTFSTFDIFVNTTPLGTKGELENETVVTARQIENVKLVYDLVYNPFQTRLMNEADKVNVPKIGGLAMLVAQAMAQQKIWTGLDAPIKEMSAAVLKRLS